MFGFETIFVLIFSLIVALFLYFFYAPRYFLNQHTENFVSVHLQPTVARKGIVIGLEEGEEENFIPTDLDEPEKYTGNVVVFGDGNTMVMGGNVFSILPDQEDDTGVKVTAERQINAVQYCGHLCDKFNKKEFPFNNKRSTSGNLVCDGFHLAKDASVCYLISGIQNPDNPVLSPSDYPDRMFYAYHSDDIVTTTDMMFVTDVSGSTMSTKGSTTESPVETASVDKKEDVSGNLVSGISSLFEDDSSMESFTVSTSTKKRPVERGNTLATPKYSIFSSTSSVNGFSVPSGRHTMSASFWGIQ